jgi:hypothetical protein
MYRFIVSFDMVVTIAASVTLQLAPVAANAATIRTIALKYQQAPGTSNGESYGQFNAPVINDHGQTAFWANLGGNNYDGGIWSEASGSLALVARAGSQAPGTPDGATFAFFTPLPTSCGGFCTTRWLGSPVLLDNSGQTAFTALLNGSGISSSNGSGIWSERSGRLQLVARKGNQAPTAPIGLIFTSEFFPNPRLKRMATRWRFLDSTTPVRPRFLQQPNRRMPAHKAFGQNLLATCCWQSICRQ